MFLKKEKMVAGGLLALSGACGGSGAGVCFTADSVGKETAMKIRGGLFVAVAMLTAVGVAGAQEAGSAASAAPDLTPVANPGSGIVETGVARYGEDMGAAGASNAGEAYSF